MIPSYHRLSGIPSNNPQSGQVRFDSGSNTAVKHIFISVMTSDNININVFLSEINDVSIIYLQDKNSSTDWVRYTVQGITLYPAYVDINVTYLSSSGLGGSDFGESEPIFMSIFDNSSAISNRITSLETKTQHQSATSIETRFNSPINMYDHKIYNVSDPISLKDVSNRNYVDTSINALNISSYLTQALAISTYLSNIRDRVIFKQE